MFEARRFNLLAVSAFCLTSLVALCSADDRVAADKAALSRLQELVGAWRGVGQPRRGSSQGAWTETADWAWKFTDGRAMLVFDSPKGKYYLSGKLFASEDAESFDFVATRADRSGEDRFSGEFDKTSQLILLAKDGAERAADSPTRITIRTVADGDRLLVLYEKQTAGERYARLAEVGYTRTGISFAKGSGEPECVVTGGLGTIAVEYQGKKYYVCCTGCRDLFNDDPEGVLAEYRERKAAERANASK